MEYTCQWQEWTYFNPYGIGEGEASLFINTPLAVIGKKFVFFDECVETQGSLANPKELRQVAQIALVGSFVP